MSPFNSSSVTAIVKEFNSYDWYGPNLPPTWGQHPDFEKRMNQVFEKHINLLLCQPTCIESYSGTPTKCSCISRCSKADLLRNLQSYAWTHQSERLQFLSHYISLGFFSSQADIDDGMHCIQTEALPSNYFNPEYKGPKIPNSREVCTNTYRNLFAITRSEWSFIKLIASKNHRLWAWALENLLPPRGLHRLPISDKAVAPQNALPTQNLIRGVAVKAVPPLPRPVWDQVPIQPMQCLVTGVDYRNRDMIPVNYLTHGMILVTPCGLSSTSWEKNRRSFSLQQLLLV